MSKVVGDVAVSVGADVSGLEKGMKRGGKAVKRFDKDSAAMAKRMAKVGVTVAAAVAGIGIAVTAMMKNAAQTGKEIRNLSRLSGVSSQEFQKFAIAAESVSISQEKVADIFKDVNDKFGDFMANGAGPLKDFFENIAPAVGVTAEQFANLSGPDALQLYVSSLEKAGVSQQQMTFYMEALASDATTLIPLLQNNGKALKDLGKEAEDAGRILSEDMLDNAEALDKKFRDFSRTMQDKATKAVLEYSDEILAAADWIIEDLIPAIGRVMDTFGEFVTAIQPAIDKLGDFIGLASAAMGLDGGEVATYSPENQARIDGDLADTNNMGGDDPSSTGTGFIDENGNWVEYGVGDPNADKPRPGINAPANKPKPRTKPSKRSGGGGGLDLEDLDAFREVLATEAEELEIWREEQLEKLREFRDAKLATEDEYNELEARINKEHADKMAEVERRAQEARLRQWGTSLGDLAGLAQSSNKKLFKIGQAAAVAEAVVGGYSAAVSAWEKGMAIGGPPLAAAFTSASLAKTGALISGIKGASSAGGGVAAGSAAGVAPESTPNTYYNVSLQGEGAIGRNGVRDLIEAINDEIQDGAVIRGITVS